MTTLDWPRRADGTCIPWSEMTPAQRRGLGYCDDTARDGAPTQETKHD